MRERRRYLIIPLLLLTGCGDSVDFDSSAFRPSLQARYVRVSNDTFHCLNADATHFDFAITSIDTPWSFSDVLSWMTVSPLSGSQSADITLGVEENLSGDMERVGVFYLNSFADDWEYTAPISVSQPAATPYASPEKTGISLNGTSGNGTISVIGNCRWTALSDAPWLTVSENEDRTAVSYTIEENQGNVSRTATISLNLDAERLAYVAVTQKAAGITMETSTLQFENTAGAYELTLSSEAAWTASTSQDWLEVAPSSGNAGQSKITVSALPNASVSDRSGYVYLYIGTKKVVEIPVTQRGLFLAFGLPSLSLGADGETGTIPVISNTTWTISSYPEWLTISPLSGNGSQDITVKAEDNPNVTERSGVIRATQDGLNLPAQLTVRQAGKTFGYGDSQISCSDKEQTISIDVTTTGKWTAGTIDSWLSVTPDSHTGSTQLSIHVDENGTDDSRTGIVTLTIGNKSYDIRIVQSGKYFTVNYKDHSFGSTESSLAIEVVTNDSWMASVQNDPSWISLSKTSGTGNADFTATIADNPSVNGRSATIVLSTVHDKSVKIQISQAARYLTVDHRLISFFAVGGTSEDITISTDGAYSITGSDAWFRVTEKAHGLFNVTATENTTKQIREGSITIKLTDLKEGSHSLSIPVLQTADGAKFFIMGYDEDKNWDIAADASVALTVTGYGSDKNWDSVTPNTDLTITISGYTGEKNWDTATSSSGSVSFDGFPSDKNWGN